MDLGLLDIPNSLHLLVSPQNEFINSVDLEEVRWRAALKIKSSLRECYLRIAQFDVVKEIKNWHLVVFFIFYILFFDSGIARTLVLPRTGIRSPHLKLNLRKSKCRGDSK